ncbi:MULTISPECIES: DUF2147 domain-containing protein [Halocynthiibacter]|uniref:DUF2147 domain-containing protein n=1 Tax=Halocynthiibacter halioticoli TaxID=2986804 RepID=A0AAE3J0I2_9RHOB|nr:MULTISPECIES: DUF2147 domain-containing protein [Halocynthiibacter]MCV6823906.1 DUF2147 domain-containing protein [Halocynthiibacter halioticoli]MCW4056907.1 DUF2147 domain-containing protein [Halocynthiibacter sp. SDUM655004]
MKKLGLSLAALVVAATGALADPVAGVWKTQEDEGAFAHVTLAPCGDKICGVISRTFRAEGEFKSDTIGKPLVWDMVAQGGGNYKDGKIWQPSKDKVYRSKMALSGDTLKVSGCIGPICKKQTWTRVD